MVELTYTQVGDYLVPDLALDDETAGEPLGKYGVLRQGFLMDHHRGTYTSMLLGGRLIPHLKEVDQQAREQVDSIVNRLKA